MKFIVTWNIPKAYVHQAQARFLQTGGQPPAGVKMIGRWHGMSGGGILVAETDRERQGPLRLVERVGTIP